MCGITECCFISAAETETMALINIVTNQPERFGCKKECTTPTYKYKLDGYGGTVMPSTFELCRNITTHGRIYINVISNKVQVMQEFEVYDLSGIIGSVGGSLGLFIGFSFLQFLLSTLKTLTDIERKGSVRTEQTVKSVSLTEVK